MKPADYGLVLIFLISGLVLGWFANKAYSSNGDVKTGKQRLAGYRRSRHKNGFITAILAIIIGVVVFNVLGPHP